MAACPKCGSKVADDAKFCASCGSTITPAAGAPTASPSQATPPGPTASGSQGGIAPNVAGLLVYFPGCIGLVCAILFAFVLDPYKKDRFIRFHAWQSLALHVCFVGFFMVWMVFVFVVTAIIHFLGVLLIPVNMLIALGALVLMVLLMIKAYGMETYKVPVIGDWAEKQANG
jgi:uncharacterized membrane protein